MPEESFVERLKKDIKKIDKELIDEEFKKIGPVVVAMGNGENKGDLTYFLKGLCGVDLSNFDVSRIKWKFIRKNNFWWQN